MKFNLIGITPDSVQRNFKLVYDFRKEETNERKSIFEIGQFNRKRESFFNKKLNHLKTEAIKQLIK